MTSYQVCPVCCGRGLVHHGFYNTAELYMSTSTADEQCRRCRGQGTILAPTFTVSTASELPPKGQHHD